MDDRYRQRGARVPTKIREPSRRKGLTQEVASWATPLQDRLRQKGTPALRELDEALFSRTCQDRRRAADRLLRAPYVADGRGKLYSRTTEVDAGSRNPSYHNYPVTLVARFLRLWCDGFVLVVFLR